MDTISRLTSPNTPMVANGDCRDIWTETDVEKQDQPMNRAGAKGVVNTSLWRLGGGRGA